MESNENDQSPGPDYVLHPDIVRKVKKYWWSERATWSRGGFELEDLLQLVRIKLFLQVPAEVLQEKGLGYKVRIVANFLKDELRKLKAEKNTAEDQLIDLLNEKYQGKAEHGESGVSGVNANEAVDLNVVEEQAQYLTSSQKLAGTGYRIKRLRKPGQLSVMYDIRYPRRYHCCFVLRCWLILDVMANQKDCSSRYEDIECIKKRLRRRKEGEQLPFPLKCKGNKTDVTDYPIPLRLTDKDLRIRREDPVSQGQLQHRKDFFKEFY